MSTSKAIELSSISPTVAEKKEPEKIESKPEPPTRTCCDFVLDNLRFFVFGSVAVALLVLFSISTAYSYQQAKDASTAAVPYDDRSAPGDTNQWFLQFIKSATPLFCLRFLVPLTDASLVSASA